MKNIRALDIAVIATFVVTSMLSIALAIVYSQLLLLLITFATISGGLSYVPLRNILMNRSASKSETHPVIQKAVEWLGTENTVVRTKHTLELTLSAESNACETFVKVTGVHSYELTNYATSEGGKLPIDIYTDLGPDLGLTGLERGGFESISVNNIPLSRDKITEINRNVINNAKVCYEDDVDITAERSMLFKYVTFAYYRPKDRLIWTVQDISDDFVVTIVNNTDLASDFPCFKYWYNHHKRKNIHPIRNRHNLPRNVEQIRFPDFVLPYQGLEISWDFNK
jgi:hypothetical protein